MSEDQLEKEIQWRLYCWAQTTVRREVAEDFPLLQSCQHNRDVRCFLSWMKEMPSEERLRVWLMLAMHSSRQVILSRGGKYDVTAEDTFRLEGSSTHRYHHLLSPTPDSDPHAPGFVKADIERCKAEIIEALQSVLGSPRRRERQMIWYIQKYGDWFFTTRIEIRRKLGPLIECRHFLRRADSSNPQFLDSSQLFRGSIMLLGILGVSATGWFPLIGRSHEQLCAQSVRAVTEPLVAIVPKLIEGLEIDS